MQWGRLTDSLRHGMTMDTSVSRSSSPWVSERTIDNWCMPYLSAMKQAAHKLRDKWLANSDRSDRDRLEFTGLSRAPAVPIMHSVDRSIPRAHCSLRDRRCVGTRLHHCVSA